MSEELKPCPHCGSSATIYEGQFSLWEVRCDNKHCGSTMFATHDSREHTAHMWNTRAEPTLEECRSIILRHEQANQFNAQQAREKTDE